MTRLAVPLLIASAMLAGCISVNASLGSGREKLRPQPVLAVGEEGSRDRVALIPLRGVIVDAPDEGLLGSRPGPLASLGRQLAMAEADDRVRAVVLRVDSPGGSVAASEMAYREIRMFRERTGKPVVISMGEVAASGGYYAALAGDRIVAEPTTLTGSIGVVVASLNVSEGLERIGVESRFVTSGPNKDIANPLAPVRTAHYRILQGLVDEYYGRFRGLVVQRRDALATGSVDELTDGRVFTGETARRLGLVDELGGVRTAFLQAVQLAGLESATLVRYAPRGGPPQTIYAEAPLARPMAVADASVSGIRVDAASLGLPTGMRPGVAYYLYLP